MKSTESTTKSFRSFSRFLSGKSQRRELAIIAAAFIGVGMLLHILFPYPFSFPDSGAYLLGASQNSFNIYRPMGYSHYLQFVHAISSSIHTVFWFTYLLHMLSALFLIYSIKYLWDLRNKVLFYGLCFFAVAAPRFLFASNFIMSDSLFSSLTVLFLTFSIWLLYERKWYVIVILLALFMGLYRVRYSGMFYIFIPLYTLYMAYAKAPLAKRLLMLALPLVCFFIVFQQSKKEYYQQTGVNISSGFSGWQLINNASVLFPQAKGMSMTTFKDPVLKALHGFMQSVPDSIFNSRHTFATNYMWNKELPYKQFMFYYMDQTRQNYSLSWILCGDLYGQYAKALIAHYPWQFTRDFLLPSFLSNFNYYDINEYKAPFKNEPLWKDYYQLTIDQYAHTNTLFAQLNPLRHVMHYIYWTISILAFCYFLLRIRKTSWSRREWQTVFVLWLFIVTYVGASAVASPNTTWRYTMPIYLPSLVFIVYNLNEFMQKRKIGGKLLFQRKK